MSHLRILCAVGLSLTGSMMPQAQGAFPTLALKPLALKQIHSPTTITYAPDGSGRLFICDQPGKIYILQGGMLLPTPFLDITARAMPQTSTYSERGLLGLAFHPGYANPLSPGFRKFYLNYNKPYVLGNPDFDPPPPTSDHIPNCVTVIAEFQVSATNPNLADPLSERRILRFTQPQSNHNGGQVEFGPDGFLYVGAGDGGRQDDNDAGHTGGGASRPTDNLGNGQDKTRYLGKILRIDPFDPDGSGPMNYDIPVSNPFFNDPAPDIKKEIYAYGLRNPWKFSFDKRPGGTDRLFCGDVGGRRIEEVNLIVAGGNYGWRYKEGFELPSFSSGATSNPMTLAPAEVAAMIDPIAVYAHTDIPATDPTSLPKLGVSIIGGFVYRGSAIPAMQGKYVFGDYGAGSTPAGRMMGLEETSPNSGAFTLNQALSFINSSNPVVGQRILCLGEDERGEIYIGMKTKQGVLELDNGSPSGGIYQIVPVVAGMFTATPTKDNTLFADNTSNSNGLGDSLFAGKTAQGSLRRALLSFDVSALPAGSILHSATLQLTVGTGQGANTLMALHRASQAWGEGTSVSTNGAGVPATVGDATWANRFHPASGWTSPGGDYVPAASASTLVSPNGVYTWTSAQLLSDVRAWVSSSLTNFGWILIGDESTTSTAKRISSREALNPAQRPLLTLTYSIAPPPSHFESWLATYFPSNPVGQFVDPVADPDGDGISNLVEYAYGFSPVSRNISNDLTVALADMPVDAKNFTVTFRRDSAATDLIYQLQTSSDLANWSTIARVTAGASAAGENGGVIVSDDSLAGGIRLVTARQTLPAGSNSKQFVRLHVERL